VLFVGSACLRKGVHYLVRAYEQLKLANAELVLAGTVAPEMETFLRKHASSFRHLGDIPKVELYGVYSQASVLVLPSIADAYPLVALEALACGLPVIISENTGTKDLITDGKEGFVVPIRDEEAIQDRLLRLYSDPERLAEMSQAASRKSPACGWDVYMDRALQIYEALGAGALAQQCG
jgi:glycosyltransferase involved in cell wall biosynthesis